MGMKNAEKVCAEIVRLLKSNGIEPIVYGSVGLSLLIGPFKEPDDVDLLVPKRWIHQDWPQLCTIVSELGYVVSDEHEHEFVNDHGEKIAFAEADVLTRDTICDPTKDLVTVDCFGQSVTTISLPSFLKAYQFSKDDSYRQSKRVMKDSEVIARIETAMQKVKRS